ncbi:helix-turn-helix transcriptional regulator [Peribacillus tepidiphilus]|uniref:helix-turn-helix transcriptional regulator n=1 Tax=Peribacillus tepidiphilus TaxID=2652445 RepID=UPI001291DECC|nr:helix-turn-helix domain-containing protein [Peribacillus tepidiphilus]
MDQEFVNHLISTKLKLIRTEYNYTQDKMASILGVSKKTLVQVEKGRSLAGWTTVVAICALFRDSEVLQACLGGDPLEIIETIAHTSISSPKEKTMGGRVWWKTIQQFGNFRLQQNIISQHYRILDNEEYRWYSSFDQKEALIRLKELHEEMKEPGDMKK